MCPAVIASPPVARRWLQVACPLRSWRLRGSGEVCPFGAPSPCAPTGRLHGTGTLPQGVISVVNITPALSPIRRDVRRRMGDSAGVILTTLITPCGRVPVPCNLPVGAHGDGAPKGQTSPEPLRRQDRNGQAT